MEEISPHCILYIVHVSELQIKQEDRVIVEKLKDKPKNYKNW